jgi:hypothetical protein
MENNNKNRIFWDEILEIIPCGVSLRTFFPERGKEADKAERSLEKRDFRPSSWEKDKKGTN